ncbi:MAG: TrpR YerC/YecD [Clostridia bacterium]|nr:TrpR YerC/YecD [Clostridia bacterium]
MKRIRTEETDILFEAILSLKDINECRNFFDDLCTRKEINDMSQRLTVAKMLLNDDKYLDISAKTGVSSATISRVVKCLDDENSGYKNVLNKIGK